MARETRTFVDNSRFGHGYTSTAYTEDGGRTWRWSSNDSYCPLDACERMVIPCDPAAQKAARDKEVATVIRNYKRRMRNHKPSAEEMYEMRAAFGRGTTVVNVITGKKTRL